MELKLQKYYVSNNGRPGKPIRVMAGLLLLKQLDNLSDEEVVLAWKRNPYYQYFCGFKEFQVGYPCHSTELVKFRAKIGKDGFNEIFKLSVALHSSKDVNEKDIIVDSTVQEKI
ncbi:MAG: transposase [Epsilonproteobacteria bacterium]|nr:transposase [Campylobacterota bacterium]